MSSAPFSGAHPFPIPRSLLAKSWLVYIVPRRDLEAVELVWWYERLSAILVCLVYAAFPGLSALPVPPSMPRLAELALTRQAPCSEVTGAIVQARVLRDGARGRPAGGLADAFHRGFHSLQASAGNPGLGV